MKPLVRRVLDLALSCALGTFVSLPAVAASPIPNFKTTDGNGDGVVNQEEFQAQGGLEQSVAEGDTNQDKVLSREEFAPAPDAAHRLSRRAAMGTLAVLASLLTLYGCDNAGPIEQSAQEMKEDAVRMADGTAAGPGPVETLPGSAPAEAEKEDPPKP